MNHLYVYIYPLPLESIRFLKDSIFSRGNDRIAIMILILHTHTHTQTITTISNVFRKKKGVLSIYAIKLI